MILIRDDPTHDDGNHGAGLLLPRSAGVSGTVVPSTARALVCIALFCATSTLAALDLSPGNIERKIATFDPGGRYITRPIERRVPGLSVNGTYYFWSDYLVHNDESPGFRERDYRWLQAQNLLEVDLAYRISPALEISAVSHFLYDAVYDIEGGIGLYAGRVNQAFEYYDDFSRVVRELYVSYRSNKLDLVIGKQQIAWGKMDGQFIDVINPMDLRESVQLETSDFEIRRLPLWMANLTYYIGRSSLNVLWIADIEKNLNTSYGAPWSSPLLPPNDFTARGNPALLDGRVNFAGDTVIKLGKPDWYRLSDNQFAARFDSAIGALTWAAVYYYAWERDPVQFITGRFVDAAGPHLVFQTELKRMHHAGVTSDYAWVQQSVPWVGNLPMVFRLEALFTKNAHFTNFNKQALARGGALNNGISKRDTLRAALALELGFPGNTTVIFQPSLFYTFDWRKGLLSGFGGAFGDRWNFVPVFFVERPIRKTRDRLRLSATITPYLSGPDRGLQGVKSKFIAGYELSQYIRTKLVYTDYSGGDPNDLFGQFDEWDNIGIEVQYEF